jgi:hypothetical protein
MLSLLLVACNPEPEGALRIAPPSLAPNDLVDPGATSPGTGPTDPGTGTPTGGTTGDTTDPTTTGTDPLLGYIGSPCDLDADCPYEGGVCLREEEGFPLGTCSASCTQFCDDADGYPTTFCAEIAALPPDVAWLGDGGCLSRCDFGLYPHTGCRQDYGCVPTERANEPGTETYVCLPNVESELSACVADLAGRGVPFSPTTLTDDHPTDVPSLTCHVEEPIVMQSGYLGVDLIYSTGSPGTVLGACSLGQAIADSIEDIAPDGVVAIHHLGTYNCRTIAGTTTLSRHGYGDAIDIASFEFDNGDEYFVEFDWEIDDPTPESAGGLWLYETAYGWNNQALWNIILTPDYNAAHYNHFHTDLTPGSDFIGFAPFFPYIGPSPWADE